MFERFTERARQVVVRAQEDARALGHDYIGTEHLLLGLIRVEDGAAALVLGELGVTHEEVRRQIVAIIGEGESERGAGQIPFTPRAKKVLELSLRQALAIGHNYIGTEHVLLGLVREGEGVANRILLDFGVTGDVVEAAVMARVDPPQPVRRRRRGFPVGRRMSFETAPVAQWEYRAEQRPPADQLGEWLNGLGAEGWELAAIVGEELVLKRPCRPAREQSA